MTDEIKQRLKDELKKLQSNFNKGYDLTVTFLPDTIRYSQNGKPLAGEVRGTVILIYESKEEAAIQTLFHEFVEAVFVAPLLKHCYSIMHDQQEMLKQKENMLIVKNEIIHKLLMQLKENVVDSLAIPLSRLMKEA